MTIRRSVLELIGNTPMLRAQRLDTGSCELFLKLESANPGGSIKDRIGLSMIEGAEKAGRIEPGAILVGRDVGWQSGALRATFAELAAGAQAEVIFTAKVAAGVPAGKVIVNRATATAGAASASASAAIAMPPAELPAVGSGAVCIR